MKQSLLVGDIGSTSATWRFRGPDSEHSILTEGFNPNSHSAGVLDRMISAVTDKCPSADAVYYYGSGVSSSEIAEAIASVITERLGSSICEVRSDLLGAARACCGDKDGIVAILGTGSNCSIYENGLLTAGAPSLGYPLGDEGGGWRIGASMIKGYYYGQMPDRLRDEFAELLPDSRQDLLAYLHQSPTPNRYLASFATFASAHMENLWVSESVSNQLKDFIETQVEPLLPQVPIHFVGGIASAFDSTLKQLLEQSGLASGSILNDPIQALLEYHLNDE